MRSTIAQIAADLGGGRISSEDLVEECLTRIADARGEGARAFLEVSVEGARTAARAIDALRRVGAEPSPYAGIPVSIKDLFDVRGQVTRAGSKALQRPPAERDATAVERWRRAGLILIGRTNMTEFAFSGLGINPHYGTPANPWDRDRCRIPGGSSSGAAVSLTDEMAHGALGTDTGGSCRIPAALCGLVAFKPTQARIPRDGCVPLSSTLDTVGVLGRSVDCCRTLAALAAGEEPGPLARFGQPPRLGVPRSFLLEDLDDHVASDFARLTASLSEAGAQIVDVELAELDRLAEMNAARWLCCRRVICVASRPDRAPKT